MIKFERVKEIFESDAKFSFRSEEFDDCAAFRITLFGKTFRIKYSKKFNYFLIAFKTLRTEEYLGIHKVATGKLAQIVLEQALAKEGVPVSNLEILLNDGKSPGFNFKGLYEGTPVFIKLNIYSVPPSQTSTASWLRREYENGMLLSSGCPYCLKPIAYLELPQFEILVTPLIENGTTLHNCTRSIKGVNAKWVSQLQEVRNYMKENNFVHGDLHGSNIFIGSVNGGEKQVYIIDFTAARQIKDGSYFESQEYKSDEINFNRFFNAVKKGKVPVYHD